MSICLATSALAADPQKVFRYAFEIAETSFDPAVVDDLYSTILINNVLDTPLTYDYLARPVKLIPKTLAGMPEVTQNGTLYTMRVKPGIYFHVPPGEEDVFKGQRRELVAEDYVYSLKRVFDPKRRSPNLYLIEGNIAGMDEVLARARRENRFDYDAPIEGLRALDRYTFQIRLKQPNYNFLYYLAYCNLFCAVAREVDERYPLRAGEHPVGTGPYMLTFWKRSSKMVFEANPDYREEYFDGSPAQGDEWNEAVLAANKGKRLPIVGKVEVYIVEEQQPRYLAFLNNEFDFLERLNAEFANVAIPGNQLAGDLRRRGIRMQRTPGIEVT
ncbi:MAG: ABC transporter substrate-binding protein, partial [Bacillota bacterium]